MHGCRPTQCAPKLAFSMPVRARVRSFPRARVCGNCSPRGAGYRHDVWWFEMVDLFHKLTLTSLLGACAPARDLMVTLCPHICRPPPPASAGFFPPSMQLPAGMVVAGVFIMTLLRVHPYIRQARGEPFAVVWRVRTPARRAGRRHAAPAGAGGDHPAAAGRYGARADASCAPRQFLETFHTEVSPCAGYVFEKGSPKYDRTEDIAFSVILILVVVVFVLWCVLLRSVIACSR